MGVLDSGQCPHAHFAPINGAGAGPPFHGHGHLSLLPCREGDSGRARRRAGLARGAAGQGGPALPRRTPSRLGELEKSSELPGDRQSLPWNPLGTSRRFRRIEYAHGGAGELRPAGGHVPPPPLWPDRIQGERPHPEHLCGLLVAAQKVPSERGASWGGDGGSARRVSGAASPERDPGTGVPGLGRDVGLGLGRLTLESESAQKSDEECAGGTQSQPGQGLPADQAGSI